jgi:hypothetical protein
VPVAAPIAGAARTGGWISPCGRFYPAPYLHHIRVAAELRAAGYGPAEPWLMRDGWTMVRSTGEALALPCLLTQAQLDALGDVLTAAPPGAYRTALMGSLRLLRELTDGADGFGALPDHVDARLGAASPS